MSKGVLLFPPFTNYLTILSSQCVHIYVCCAGYSVCNHEVKLLGDTRDLVRWIRALSSYLCTPHAEASSSGISILLKINSTENGHVYRNEIVVYIG